MTNPETAVTVQTGDWKPREVIRLGDYDRSRYNVLIPGAFSTQVTPFLVPVAREYALDPDPEHGEVYVQEWTRRNGEFVAKAMGINALGLANLANVAGILEIPQASGRVDDGRDAGVCTYRSTMFMRLPDGQPVIRTRELTLELAMLLEEARDRIEKKGRENKYNGKPEPWPKDKVEAEIRKESFTIRRFFHRKCETGAKARTHRVLLGIRGKYTPAEISRPFILAAVVPDVNQPEVRERLLEQSLSATAMVFGSSGPIGSAPRQLTAGPSAAELDEAIEEGAATGSAPLPEELTEFVGIPTDAGDEEPEETAPLHATGGRAGRRRTSPDTDSGAADPGPQRGSEAGEAAGEPDWITGGAAKPATPALADLVAARLRDEGQPKGPVNENQKARLRDLFAPLGEARGALFVAGLAALDMSAEGLTCAQARAIEMSATELGDDPFRAAWQELAGGAS